MTEILLDPDMQDRLDAMNRIGPERLCTYIGPRTLVPAAGSVGARFLRDCVGAMNGYVSEHGRFPKARTAHLAGAEVSPIGEPSELAQIYADLGLWTHREAPRIKGMAESGLRMLVRIAAEFVAESLVRDFAP